MSTKELSLMHMDSKEIEDAITGVFYSFHPNATAYDLERAVTEIEAAYSLSSDVSSRALTILDNNITLSNCARALRNFIFDVFYGLDKFLPPAYRGIADKVIEYIDHHLTEKALDELLPYIYAIASAHGFFGKAKALGKFIKKIIIIMLPFYASYSFEGASNMLALRTAVVSQLVILQNADEEILTKEVFGVKGIFDGIIKDIYEIMKSCKR